MKPNLATADQTAYVRSTYSTFGAASTIDLLELSRRYFYTLVGLPIVGALLAMLIATRLTPIYTGTSLLQVDPTPSRAIQEIKDPYDPGYGTSKYFTTQLYLIQSRKLAKKLAEHLKLDQLAEFSDMDRGWINHLRHIYTWLPFLPSIGLEDTRTPLELEKQIIDRVLAATNVEIVTDSNLFRIHFKSEDPELSAKAANTLADLYIEELLEARLEITKKAADWLTKNLADISGELNQASQNLQIFREQENIVNVGGNYSLLEEETLDLSRRVLDAKRKRQELQNAYSEINKAGSSPEALKDVSALLIDPVVKSAADTYFFAQDAVRKLEKRYGTRHPEMSAAQSRLTTAKRAYFDQLRIKAQGIKSQYEIARQNERELVQAAEKAKLQVQKISRKQYEFGQLERQVESSQQLYDLFLARFKETQSTTSYDEVNARIADAASTPSSPSFPRKSLFVAIGLFSGFLLALIASLLREMLRASIESAHDLEQISNIPVIGVLPRIPRKFSRKPIAHSIEESPKMPFADGIRSIAASIAVSDIDKDWKCIAITSALPSDGKSTICSALATVLSHNERVVVIDADLRRPSVHKMFGSGSSRAGVSSVLSGQVSLEEALSQDPVTGAHILTAGKTPANPAKLLNSTQFKTLLSQLAEQFDRIILDTPPCSASSDALQIATLVDAYVVVARSEKTPRKAFEFTLKQLNTVNAEIAGLVLNDAAQGKGYGSYYYGAYYGEY